MQDTASPVDLSQPFPKFNGKRRYRIDRYDFEVNREPEEPKQLFKLNGTFTANDLEKITDWAKAH